MTRGRWLATVTAVLAAAACFDGPTAGEVTLALSTPYSDDGAVAFVVTVAAPNEITGASAMCAGCDVFTTKVSVTEMRGMVLGDVVPGPVVRLAVANAGPNQVYHVQLLEVATRAFAVRPPSGYNLTVQ